MQKLKKILCIFILAGLLIIPSKNLLFANTCHGLGQLYGVCLPSAAGDECLWVSALQDCAGTINNCPPRDPNE